jgi:hypothetical protein
VFGKQRYTTGFRLLVRSRIIFCFLESVSTSLIAAYFPFSFF